MLRSARNDVGKGSVLRNGAFVFLGCSDEMDRMDEMARRRTQWSLMRDGRDALVNCPNAGRAAGFGKR